MTPLMTGLYSKFTADTDGNLYTALSGRLYHGEAPQGVTFPYAVMYAIDQQHDWSFSDDFEDVLVQFSIFTNESSASNIGTYWSYLKSLYDDTTLTISGYSKIHMVRTSSNLLRDTENNIWQYVTDYEVMLKQL